MFPSSSDKPSRAPAGRCNPTRNPFSIPEENHDQCPSDSPCKTNQIGLEQSKLRSAINARTNEKLCRAIENGDLEFCKLFLSESMDWTTNLRPDPRGRYSTKQLPLHTLFLTPNMSPDNPILHLLLSENLDLNLHDTFGRTALHYLMNRIYSEWSRTNTPHRNTGDFHRAIGCIEILVRAGADVNCRDGSQQTPLHTAAFFNTPSCVSILVRLGADVDVKDINGNSPMHVCAMFSHAETLAALLENGANPALGNARGEAPLHIAAKNYAQSGLGCVKLLLAAVTDVNQTDHERNTALHLAVYGHPNPDIITRLLNRGADPDLRNAKGQSALFVYLNNNLVELHHRPVLRPARLILGLQVPELGKSIQHSEEFCLIMDHSTTVRFKDKDDRLPRILNLPETADLTRFLRDLATTPRTLLFLSRQAVRKALKPVGLNWAVCTTLELPRQLVDYVMNPLYKKDRFAPWSLDQQA